MLSTTVLDATKCLENGERGSLLIKTLECPHVPMGAAWQEASEASSTHASDLLVQPWNLILVMSSVPMSYRTIVPDVFPSVSGVASSNVVATSNAKVGSPVSDMEHRDASIANAHVLK